MLSAKIERIVMDEYHKNLDKQNLDHECYGDVTTVILQILGCCFKLQKASEKQLWKTRGTLVANGYPCAGGTGPQRISNTVPTL